MNKQCPNCGISWEMEENIYEYFRNSGCTKGEATETALAYGCTKDSPKHFVTNVIGIEYPNKYDGVYEWNCTSCNHVIPRFKTKQ